MSWYKQSATQVSYVKCTSSIHMPGSDQVAALRWVYVVQSDRAPDQLQGEWQHTCQLPPVLKSTCPVVWLETLRLWMNSRVCWVPNQCYVLSILEPIGLYLNLERCLAFHWSAHEPPAMVKSSSHLGWEKLRGKDSPRSRGSTLLATQRRRRWSNTSVFYHLSLSEKQRKSKGISI